jgi:hypothetical protein
LARQFVGRGHREQPKISEEGIWPLFMIALASPLTWSVLLPAQYRPQPATNKSVD